MVMTKNWRTLSARAVPLLRDNIDTDAIIPSREIKGVSKTGLADGLFAGWRYGQKRTENPDFVLNQPQYAAAKILLAGANFGCGSSREQAVWALAEYGFRAIAAESFGEIFYNNCINNGILPIKLAREQIEILAQNTQNICIDLPAQTIEKFGFDINPAHKKMLIEGLDAIGLTDQDAAKISQFEQKHFTEHPWVRL